MQVDEPGSVFRYLLPLANDVQQINRGESHLFFFFFSPYKGSWSFSKGNDLDLVAQLNWKSCFVIQTEFSLAK